MAMWEIDTLLKKSIRTIKNSKLNSKEKKHIIWSLEKLPQTYEFDAGSFEMIETDEKFEYKEMNPYELGLQIAQIASEQEDKSLIYDWSAFLLNFYPYFQHLDSYKNIKSKYLKPIRKLYYDFDFNDYKPIYSTLTIYNEKKWLRTPTKKKFKKIREATEENPYLLIEDRFTTIYTYDNKVYDCSYKKIEIPNADPYSLMIMKSGIIKDKDNVFNSRLAPNSPPATIKTEIGTINNPNAIYEYYSIPEIDSNSFEEIKEKYDTIYYRDKNSIFYDFKKIEKADRNSFEYLDFCYGKDKNFIFCRDKIIDINVNDFFIDRYGFIYDKNNIYYYENQIFLDIETFQVLGNERGSNNIFILKDKNGEFFYNKITNILYIKNEL